MAAPAALADAIHRWGTGIAWPRGTRDEEIWQRAVLAEEMAALGTAEPPTDDELWGRAPDPGSDPPGDAEATSPRRHGLPAARRSPPRRGRDLFPPGLPRAAGPGPDPGSGTAAASHPRRPSPCRAVS